MSRRFSKEVEDALRAAGWSEGRRVNTQEPLRRLRERGVVVSPVAEEFLAEFHGLFIKRTYSIPGYDYPIHGWARFDVDEALSALDENEIATVENLVGESLCPVGEAARAVLFISSTGQVYYWDVWDSIGHCRTVSEAFESEFAGLGPMYRVITFDRDCNVADIRIADWAKRGLSPYRARIEMTEPDNQISHPRQGEHEDGQI